MEIEKFDFSKLKAGDKVLVCDRYGETVVKVEKITPSGFVRVQGRLYYSDGSSRSSDIWYKPWLKPWTQEKENELKREHMIAKVVDKLNKLRVSDLDYDTAVKIADILANKKGNTHGKT